MKRVMLVVAMTFAMGLGTANAGLMDFPPNERPDVPGGTVSGFDGFVIGFVVSTVGNAVIEHSQWAKANPEQAAKNFKTVIAKHKGSNYAFETTVLDFESCADCVKVK